MLLFWFHVRPSASFYATKRERGKEQLATQDAPPRVLERAPEGPDANAVCALVLAVRCWLVGDAGAGRLPQPSPTPRTGHLLPLGSFL